jgi:hypothetical protein
MQYVLQRNIKHTPIKARVFQINITAYPITITFYITHTIVNKEKVAYQSYVTRTFTVLF